MNPDVHTLTGAYALNALGELERRQFEAHLTECPDCVREVGELRATATRLGAAVAEAPPDRIRQRVLDRITTTRQEAPDTRSDGAGGHPQRRWALRLTAAAAAVALIAAAALATVTVRTQQRLDTVQSQLAQAQARYAPVGQVMAQPDARIATGAATVGGTGIAIVSRTLNEVVLLGAGMPPAPAGRSLQAWLMGVGNPRPAGLLHTGPDNTTAPLVYRGLSGEKKIALTIEPIGGSPQPTTTPIMLFDLPT